MWKTILNLSMQLIGKNLNVKIFHADFEKAAHIAVLQSFPQCKIICCTFHLGQSWFRRLKKNKILLKEYSKNDSEIGRWLKYFFGLPYLNSDEVPDAFTELISIAPSNISMDFPDYILKNYIDFGPELWASAPNDSPRTTNGVENFHMHFNSQFYTPHPHIHQIIQILMEIQVDTDLKIKSLKKNKENTRRTEILKKQNFLKKYIQITNLKKLIL
ncbi:uncharacterized protein LOC132934811 [Metopolophium dirhodum]|uniref:uncharacterized protein LOC132934811 n=1 Tax=Metopolophium dirhodum TaxID=44670 RepID=UPI00298FC5AD|nr:uncharacterized protein LOC132934811 [Metopolophium dirhodum]